MNMLREFNCNFCLPTLNESKMLPIHWAASDGKVESMKFILTHYPSFQATNENTPSSTVTTKSLDAQDSNGYTPVMITTQYNHALATIFLIKAGCDMTIVDVNGDVALHWSAYKGHIELVGLLTYYTPLAVEQYDLFGQTPLHLASLRGNTDVVEYLMYHCHADVLKKDKNGQLPLDIAIKKQHFRTEWMVRRYMYEGNFTGLVRSLGGAMQLMKNPRALNAIFMGTQEKDMMVWPWRIVAISNLGGTLSTLYFCTEVALLDFYWFHMIGCIIWMMWWFFFLGCLFVSPGVCVDNLDHKAGVDVNADSEQRAFLLQNREEDPEASVGNGLPDRSFDEALNLICNALQTPDSTGPSVCYTCKLRKPLRSKHCKIAGKCIQKFDHFCPFVGKLARRVYVYVFISSKCYCVSLFRIFVHLMCSCGVGNTVGRDNYKYFIGLLTVHFIGGVMWTITAVYLTYRVRVSWWFVIFMVYSCMWLFMIMGLGSYHLQLVVGNMSTNEHINSHRYPHFKDNRGAFHNPFERRSFIANLIDALFPSKVNLYSREEALEKLR